MSKTSQESEHTSSRTLLICTIVFTLPFLLFGMKLTWTSLRLKMTGVQTQGRVVEIEKVDCSTGGNMNICFSPRVQFQTQDGQSVVVLSKFESGESLYNVGDTVDLYYDPEDPNEMRVYTTFQFWGFPLGFLAMGLVAFALGIAQTLHARKREMSRLKL